MLILSSPSAHGPFSTIVTGAGSLHLLTLLLAVTTISACASREPALNKPVIDMSPVDCGYKWFQTGRAPPLARDCTLPRDSDLRTTQEALAASHAWEIAAERCPATCPPGELTDTSVWEEPYPDGFCADGLVHYTARVFFQCGQPL